MLTKICKMTLKVTTIAFGVFIASVCMSGCNDSPINRGNAAAIIANECNFTGSTSISVNDIET